MDSGHAQSNANEKPKFLAQVRHAAILDWIQKSGSVTVNDLAQRLSVSEMTVRRDLVELERDGKVIRTHGGAIRPERPQAGGPGENFDLEEPSFEARLTRNEALKRRIAATAAELATGARTIAIDVGTTTYLLAECLADRPHTKIFTNSLRSAARLGSGSAEVYLAGGRIRSEEMSTSGQTAVGQFDVLWFDVAFIGVSGLTTEGIYDYSFEETDMKRVYLRRATRRVVLCDSTKFNRMSLVLVAGITDFNTLITDSAPPLSLAEALAEAGVEIIVAA